jgi:hypothetical protein
MILTGLTWASMNCLSHGTALHDCYHHYHITVLYAHYTPTPLFTNMNKERQITTIMDFFQEGHLKCGTFGINSGHRDILSKNGMNGNPSLY